MTSPASAPLSHLGLGEDSVRDCTIKLDVNGLVR